VEDDVDRHLTSPGGAKGHLSGTDSAPISFMFQVARVCWDTRPISVLPHLHIDLEDHQNLKMVSDWHWWI